MLKNDSIIKGYRVKRDDWHQVGPEEILLDSRLAEGEESLILAEQKMELPLTRRVALIFLVLAGAAIFVFWARVLQLQFFEGQKYQALAKANQSYTIPLAAPRGLIFDRAGKVLAQNKASYDLLVNFRVLGETEEKRRQAFDRLKSFLAEGDLVLDAAQVEALLETPPQESIALKNDLSQEEMLNLESVSREMTGVFIEESALRSYSLGEAAAHLIGYLGKISPEEKEEYQNYYLSEKVGKDGIEDLYEKFLRGRPGLKKYSLDSRPEQDEPVFQESAQAGQSVVLNLDLGLQTKLFESLNSRYLALKKSNPEVSGASAVALDPRTGGILAMVSLPSYDANRIVDGLSAEEFAEFFENKTQPLFNRAIAGQYPAGSTIKPVMGAAALQEGVVKVTDRFDDMGGVLSLVNPYSANVVYSFRDWAVHGVVDLYSAIAESCNVYFYMMGGGYEDFEGLGAERIAQYFKKFGLGKKTGIDLPGEKDGFVPTVAWKKEVKNDAWYIGDTYHLSIGQGDLLVTPLQMASAVAAIANGGVLYRPRVVDKVVDSEENVIQTVAPEVLNQSFIEPRFLNDVRKGMRQAVLEGSARQLAALPVSSAGKTGTAQTGRGTNTHAWFTAFAPYENPEIVIVVMVENGGEGHAAAVPVVKEALEWYFSEPY